MLHTVPRWRSLVTPVAIAVGVTALSSATSSALASTVSRSGDTITLAAGSLNNDITLDYNGAGSLRFRDGSGNAIFPGGGCTRGANVTTVLCSPAGVSWVKAWLGSGNDGFDNRTAINGEVHGEGGVDLIIGGYGFDNLFGGPAGDTILDRGGNSINFAGFQNALHGDDGGDILVNGAVNSYSTASAVLDGGVGDDLLFGSDRATDMILARDGTRDSVVSCASGLDFAQVDSIDSPAGCEVLF